MIEHKGNIWDCHKKGSWIVITTNGSVKKDGCAVMGRGVALQASKKFPSLPRELGRAITDWGNVPFAFSKYKLFTLPVKRYWYEKADIKLIKDSLQRLSYILPLEAVYMVRPGCGNGGLLWKDVMPIIEPLIDNKIIVVELSEKKRRRK